MLFRSHAGRLPQRRITSRAWRGLNGRRAWYAACLRSTRSAGGAGLRRRGGNKRAIRALARLSCLLRSLFVRQLLHVFLPGRLEKELKAKQDRQGQANGDD